MYGRLWGIAATSIVFIVILASFHSLQTSRGARLPHVAVERPPAHDEKVAAPVESLVDETSGFTWPVGTVVSYEARSTTTSSLGTTETTPWTTSSSTRTEALDANASNTTTTTTSTSTLPVETSKIVVMGKMKYEETAWVGQYLQEWQSAIYYLDLPENVTSPSGLRTKMNKGREAMPYLTYITEHYPDFPDVVAFIHPHRNGLPQAWHNDAPGNDAVLMMERLRLDTVLDRGYVNLRCNHEIGCPDEIQPFRDPPDAAKHAEHAFPYVYSAFFNASHEQMLERIPVVGTQCCAQFAVSRDQILKRPREDYQRFQSYIEDSNYDDETIGRVMEYMWHMIFDREPVACEDMFQCWCNVYGKCSGFGGPGS